MDNFYNYASHISVMSCVDIFSLVTLFYGQSLLSGRHRHLKLYVHINWLIETYFFFATQYLLRNIYYCSLSTPLALGLMFCMLPFHHLYLDRLLLCMLLLMFNGTSWTSLRRAVDQQRYDCVVVVV